MKTLWCNGLWQDAGSFPGSLLDRGLLHGMGLFETVLAVDGQPVFADRHIARINSSMARLGWTLDFDPASAMAQLLEREGLQSGRARIRLAVTAGSGSLVDAALGQDHCVWMVAMPAADTPPSIRLGLSEWRRNEHSAVAAMKCSSYAENLIALDHSRREGFEEVLFLNTAGHVCESATANVFVVRDGRVLTPDVASGCLPGITRGLVVEWAAELGASIEQCRLPLSEVMAADEVFLTSAVNGIVPVTQFQDRSFEVGPITAQTRDFWREKVGLC